VAHDFCVGPGNRGKFAGPVGLFVRPAKPGGFVMLPLGRHPETRSNGVEPLGLWAWGYSPSQRFKMDRRHRCGDRGGMASCGECLRFWRDRTRRREFLPYCRKLLRRFGRKDRQRKELPQNSRPGVTVGGVAFETDAIHDGDVHPWRWRARAGWASRRRVGAAPNSAFSCGCQPMLVG